MALRRHRHLIVGITSPRLRPGAADGAGGHRRLRDANPFTYHERVALLRAALLALVPEHRFTIVPFDMDQPAAQPAAVPFATPQYVRSRGAWESEKVKMLEEAGYTVVTVPPSGPDLSATVVRQRLRVGGWEHDVPAAAAGVLRRLLAARTIDQRVSA